MPSETNGECVQGKTLAAAWNALFVADGPTEWLKCASVEDGEMPRVVVQALSKNNQMQEKMPVGSKNSKNNIYIYFR